jgi:curved DNA-binding protein CbpA
MKSFREQTYYELLEVRRAAPVDEVRAALRRAQDAYAPDSVALYALVDEDQAEALRSRLQEAGRVLLDPAARAGYDRMLGLGPELPPDGTLWAEDEEVGVSDGPYPRTEPPSLERPGAAPPVNGAQASLKLDARPARWPLRPGAGARPPGLPSPTQRAQPPPLPKASAESRSAAPRPDEVEAGQALPPVPPAAGEERPRMPELPPDVEFNGELLRQVREARGLTLQQVAERTRIGRAHLERVEADRYADLPPSVYLRGILVSLARELKLDATRVSKSYLLLAARSGQLEP